jgi:hypothetical protein
MSDEIAISKTLNIRDCGKDEYWLQAQIAADPSILCLGDLELVRREKPQSSGGRLDLQLVDPEDNTMYEVEVMLGATDESHIIRTIEYWDLERRRFPQRQHRAVLVAEKITRRFFNVIQLLSLNIPIIAVQVSIVEADGKRMLHFSKVLDIYEEPDVLTAPPAGGNGDESWLESWQKEGSETIDCAKALLAIEAPLYPGMNLNFLKYYISLRVGNTIYFWVKWRAGGRSLIHFWLDEVGWTEAEKLLAAQSFEHDRKQNTGRIFGNADLVKENAEFFKKFGELVKQAYKRS